MRNPSLLPWSVWNANLRWGLERVRCPQWERRWNECYVSTVLDPDRFCDNWYLLAQVQDHHSWRISVHALQPRRPTECLRSYDLKFDLSFGLSFELCAGADKDSLADGWGAAKELFRE